MLEHATHTAEEEEKEKDKEGTLIQSAHTGTKYEMPLQNTPAKFTSTRQRVSAEKKSKVVVVVAKSKTGDSSSLLLQLVRRPSSVHTAAEANTRARQTTAAANFERVQRLLFSLSHSFFPDSLSPQLTHLLSLPLTFTLHLSTGNFVCRCCCCNRPNEPTAHTVFFSSEQSSELLLRTSPVSRTTAATAAVVVGK